MPADLTIQTRTIKNNISEYIAIEFDNAFFYLCNVKAKGQIIFVTHKIELNASTAKEKKQNLKKVYRYQYAIFKTLFSDLTSIVCHNNGPYKSSSDFILRPDADSVGVI